eukprot:EG_transcript_34637
MQTPIPVPELSDFVGKWKYIRRGLPTVSDIVLEDGILKEVDDNGSKTALDFNPTTGHISVDYGENDSKWEGQLSPEKQLLVWEQVRGRHQGRVRDWTKQ